MLLLTRILTRSLLNITEKSLLKSVVGSIVGTLATRSQALTLDQLVRECVSLKVFPSWPSRSYMHIVAGCNFTAA